MQPRFEPSAKQLAAIASEIEGELREYCALRNESHTLKVEWEGAFLITYSIGHWGSGGHATYLLDTELVGTPSQIARRFAERQGWHADRPSPVRQLWGGRFG